METHKEEGDGETEAVTDRVSEGDTGGESETES